MAIVRSAAVTMGVRVSFQIRVVLDIFISLGFPGGSVVKTLPAYAGTTADAGSIPGSGRSHGGGKGNLLQYPAKRIPWTEEPGGLQSMGSQRAEQLSTLFNCIATRASEGRVSSPVH